MDGGATTVLFQYGLAGVAILGLTLAVVKLYNDNQALQKQIATLQDARREDAKETQREVMSTMSGFSQTLDLIKDKLVLGKREA